MLKPKSTLRITFVLVLFLLVTTSCGLIPSESDQTGGEQQPTATAEYITPSATPTTFDDLLRPIPIESVQVEIGVGSPIPVIIHISGFWPDPCAQLSRIEQTTEGDRITIDVLASPVDPNCPPDTLGLPVQTSLPLNMAEMAEGIYTVSVNGVETSFNWERVSSEPTEEVESVSYTLSFIGADGNLWITTLGSSDLQQITMDATGLEVSSSTEKIVTYLNPKISPDGQYIAVRRDEGQSRDDGFKYSFSLVICDLTTGDSWRILDQMPAGFDWKPGTHLLAYVQAIPESYFTSKSQVDATLANSILMYDPDTRTSTELVKPEGSYAIYSPNWSPNSRYLAFAEIAHMEGSGFFAYYDFDTNTYHSWGEAIGFYTWSSDSNHILYDRLTYTASGEERIYSRPLAGGEEELVSIDLSSGYTFAPAYSPMGDKVAYFVNTGDLESQVFDLYIQDLSGGDPLIFGEFVSVRPPVWSSDGNTIFFSAGEYRSQQISGISLVDGSITTIAEGSFPTVATIKQ